MNTCCFFETGGDHEMKWSISDRDRGSTPRTQQAEPTALEKKRNTAQRKLIFPKRNKQYDSRDEDVPNRLTQRTRHYSSQCGEVSSNSVAQNRVTPVYRGGKRPTPTEVCARGTEAS